MDEEEYNMEDEELEKGSDLDRVRAILAGEGEGIDEIDQLIEMATDPQLKEMAEAIKTSHRDGTARSAHRTKTSTSHISDASFGDEVGSRALQDAVVHLDYFEAYLVRIR